MDFGKPPAAPSRGAALMAKPDAMPAPTEEAGETYAVTRQEAADLLADGEVTTSSGCKLTLDDGEEAAPAEGMPMPEPEPV